MLRFDSALKGLAFVALLTPALAAQERAVVSKEVAVGRSEASLALELEGAERMEIALSEGSVVIDGETVGAFEPGDALDTAWRALLGQAVTLEDGPLAEALRDWAPPETLAGTRLETARLIDTRLESALERPAQDTVVDEPRVTIGSGDERTLVNVLIGQMGRLGLLEDALSGLDEEIDLRVQEDVVVAEGEVLPRSLVVIQADVRVEGEVRGDVVVVDGTMELASTGRVDGDVRLVDARLNDAGGELTGRVVDVLEEAGGEPAAVDEGDLRRRLRDELRDELRSEIRQTTRVGQPFNPFRSTFRAVGGVVENLISVFLLGLIGLGVATFAGRNLDAVAETARRAPGRSAMVGVAGSFLLVPMWILGTIALVVSIVGIPVAIAWLPLFPVAAALAFLLGFLAVARNAGEWLSDTNYRWTEWIRKSNPVHTIFAGVLGMMAFFMVANVLEILPFFGVFQGFLTFVGVTVLIVASQIGFGAVLLTRAGRRPEYYPIDAEEAWRQAVEVDVEEEAAASNAGGSGGGDA